MRPPILIILLAILNKFKLTGSDLVTSNDGSSVCHRIPEPMLEEILGAAFNARYMSIEEPEVKEEPTNKSRNSNSKRTAEYVDESFSVDESYSEEIGAIKPAWEIKNHVAILNNTSNIRDGKGGSLGRKKRNSIAVDYLQEWQCESKYTWIDLGVDYFPRYLKNVECVSQHCWFEMFRCKPRSFAVKILKRRRDKCVKADHGTKVGFAGLPEELREFWVWEERALNFCCDCSKLR